MHKRCLVCQHEAIEEIDQALVSGVAHVALVGRYPTLSKFSLSRHAKNHLPQKLAKAHEAAEVAEADNLLGMIAEQTARAQRIASDAERDGEKRTTLLAVRELLRIVELQAKLAGALGDGPTVNIVLAPQWLQVRQAILVALGPFPEAREATAAALLQLEGET